MWELDCEESWVPKNWCFWTVVLDKTLGSPLDCKEIQPVHPKDQSWVFFGRTDAEAKTPILWPPHANSWFFGKVWIYYFLNIDGHEFGWTPGVGDGQGGLACCNSWGRKGSDTTEQLNWTELNLMHDNSKDRWKNRFLLKSRTESIMKENTGKKIIDVFSSRSILGTKDGLKDLEIDLFKSSMFTSHFQSL